MKKLSILEAGMFTSVLLWFVGLFIALPYFMGDSMPYIWYGYSLLWVVLGVACVSFAVYVGKLASIVEDIPKELDDEWREKYIVEDDFTGRISEDQYHAKTRQWATEQEVNSQNEVLMTFWEGFFCWFWIYPYVVYLIGKGLYLEIKKLVTQFNNLPKINNNGEDNNNTPFLDD